MTRPLMGRTRARILGVILDNVGEPPSIRELAELTGTNMNNIAGHLQALRRDGLISWEPGYARTVVPKCRWVSVGELFGDDG